MSISDLMEELRQAAAQLYPKPDVNLKLDVVEGYYRGPTIDIMLMHGNEAAYSSGNINYLASFPQDDDDFKGFFAELHAPRRIINAKDYYNSVLGVLNAIHRFEERNKTVMCQDITRLNGNTYRVDGRYKRDGPGLPRLPMNYHTSKHCDHQIWDFYNKRAVEKELNQPPAGPCLRVV